MGDGGGGLEAGMGPAWVALCVRAMSHNFQAARRREGRSWALGMGCGRGVEPGFTPQMFHRLRSLVADLHLHESGGGLVHECVV